jgi:hypothetical protein
MWSRMTFEWLMSKITPITFRKEVTRVEVTPIYAKIFESNILPMTRPTTRLIVFFAINLASAEIEENAPCQWVCDINCPYGYKMDYKTKCYKCECIDLVMTECGVPCYSAGTHSCLYAQRANSRPKCICKSEYEGVYCHISKRKHSLLLFFLFLELQARIVPALTVATFDFNS